MSLPAVPGMLGSMGARGPPQHTHSLWMVIQLKPELQRTNWAMDLEAAKTVHRAAEVDGSEKGRDAFVRLPFRLESFM